MRVLVGSVTYPLANGVTTSINTSLDRFLQDGHKMMVVGPAYSMGETRPEHRIVSSSEIGRWFLSAMHKKERMFAAGAAKEIRSLAEQFKPDAYWLHTLTWAPNAFEREMLRSKKPCVLTYHTLVEDYGRLYAGSVGAWRMRKRSKEVCNKMDAVIVPSQVIAKRLVSYGVKKPIWVIPTGVQIPKTGYTKEELAKRLHFAADATVLLYVGRVSREKNILLLIDMLQKFLKKSNATLILVGPGDIIETEQYAKNIGLERNLICTGPLPKEDTQRIYGAVDCFVFASQTETQGLVIGEAMLAGTPVVALDSSIQPEVYPDEVAMVVRRTSNFAGAVSTILGDAAKQKSMTSSAKRLVKKNFSIDGMIEKQIEVFQQLISR